MKDYYQILGIEKNASADEIKSAFRSLARKYHPDRNHEPGSKEKFQEINEAYQTLGDPNKKNAYDNPQPHFSFGGNGGFGFDDIFAQVFRQAQAQQRIQMYRVHLSLEEVMTGKTVTLPNKQTISIPVGMPNGSKLNLNDYLVQIVHVPHNRFHVDGINLVTPVKVSVFDALLGVDAEIVGLDGRKFAFKIPSCTSNGSVIRLGGQGLPDYHNPAFRGDLYVACELEMPTNLTPEQRDAILTIHKNNKLEIK